MWRIYLIGVTLALSLIMCLILDYLTMMEAIKDEAILNESVTMKADVYHWL